MGYQRLVCLTAVNFLKPLEKIIFQLLQNYISFPIFSPYIPIFSMLPQYSCKTHVELLFAGSDRHRAFLSPPSLARVDNTVHLIFTLWDIWMKYWIILMCLFQSMVLKFIWFWSLELHDWLCRLWLDQIRQPQTHFCFNVCQKCLCSLSGVLEESF